MPPNVGDRAPDFEALLCDGETFASTLLSDLLTEGERDGVVLVFAAFSFSAIAENWWKRFERADWDAFPVPVVGVSRDGPYAQNAFLRETGVPFRLFADTDATAGEAYELMSARHGMANTTTPRRAVFVVDGDQVVQYAWVADDWTSPVPRDEVESAVTETFGE